MDQATNSTESDDFGQVYSFVRVPLWFRLSYALLVAFIATGIAGAGIYEQYEKGTLWPYGLTWFGLFVVGAWIARRIYAKDVRREYATVTVEVPPSVRRNRALAATAIFVVALGILYSADQLAAGIPEALYTVLPVALAYVWALVAAARYKTTAQLTKAALIEVQRIRVAESEAKPPSKVAVYFEQLSAIWWVRYLAGFLLLICAYNVAVDHTAGRDNTILGIVLACWGAYCMREVFGWILGAAVVGGILYAILGALAGIPVSLAIIIGAIIIANSKK